MNGATGLDYAGVVAYLGEVEPDALVRAEAFECIRAAERVVLGTWAERDLQKRSQPGKLA